MAKPVKPVLSDLRTCIRPGCGDLLEGRRKKYCSTFCMCIGNVEQNRAKRAATKKPLIEKVCGVAGCRKPFTSNLPHKKYCSLDCSMFAFKENIDRNKKSKTKKKAELDVSSAGKVLSIEDVFEDRVQ